MSCSKACLGVIIDRDAPALSKDQSRLARRHYTGCLYRLGGGGLRPHRRILSHCLSRWRGYRSEVVICAVHIGVCSIRCAWRSLSSLITMRVVSTTRHSSIFVAMAVLYNVSVIITTHSNVHRLPFQVENSKKGRVSFLNFMYYSWSRERVTADCTYFAMFFFAQCLTTKVNRN